MLRPIAEPPSDAVEDDVEPSSRAQLGAPCDRPQAADAHPPAGGVLQCAVIERPAPTNAVYHSARGSRATWRPRGHAGELRIASGQTVSFHAYSKACFGQPVDAHTRRGADTPSTRAQESRDARRPAAGEDVLGYSS